MTKAGSVSVSLSGKHCLATAWWLSHRFVPYALQRSRRTRFGFLDNHVLTARRLSGQFMRFAQRRLKGDDQEREAERTLTCSDAAWLAAMILGRHDDEFPKVVFWASDFPSTDQLGTMPLELARAFVFGLDTYETMLRCHERIYGRKTGPERKSLTLADVESKPCGNPINGGDERYERRRRKRAREDEIAAAIAEEWEEAMRALDARSNR